MILPLFPCDSVQHISVHLKFCLYFVENEFSCEKLSGFINGEVTIGCLWCMQAPRETDFLATEYYCPREGYVARRTHRLRTTPRTDEGCEFCGGAAAFGCTVCADVHICQDCIVTVHMPPDVYGPRLLAACQEGNDRGVREVIARCEAEFGSATASVNHNHGAPLREAVRRGSGPCVEALLAAGADVSLVQQPGAAEGDARNVGRNALHIAAAANNEAMVGLLAARAREVIDAKTADAQAQTALHLAVGGGAYRAAQALLRAGGPCADPTVTNAEGNTPLHTLAEKCRLDTSPATLRALVDALMAAPHTPKHRGLRALKNNRGRTALHLAAVRGHAALVHVLCEKGGHVHIDEADERGETALLVALMWCSDRRARMDTVEALIQCGANVMAKRGDDSALDLIRRLGELPASLKACLDAQVNAKLDEKVLDRWCTSVLRGRRPEFDNGATMRVKYVSMRDRGYFFTPAAGDTAQVLAALERVRTGTFSVATDTTFEGLGGSLAAARAPGPRAHPHALLFSALACLYSKSCSRDDVEDYLRAYESAMMALQGRADTSSLPHPLYLFLHAQIASKFKHDKKLYVALLREFGSAVIDDVRNQWLSEEDKSMVAPERVLRELDAGGSRGSPTAGGAGAEAVPAAPADELMVQWGKLKRDLTPDQQRPMNELLELQGLRKIKKLALDVYADVKADAKLRANGHVASAAPRTLNFVFAGNPGTGKTVCARLFAQILHASGARAGQNFLDVTASDALRKGPQEFSKQLSGLTGKAKATGPPPGKLRGSRVEVKNADTREWHPATIINVQAAVGPQPKSYVVQYDNGTEEPDVPDNRVRVLKPDTAVGGVLFVDEAYDLDPKGNRDGAAILNDIMSVAEVSCLLPVMHSCMHPSRALCLPLRGGPLAYSLLLVMICRRVVTWSPSFSRATRTTSKRSCSRTTPALRLGFKSWTLTTTRKRSCSRCGIPSASRSSGSVRQT